MTPVPRRISSATVALALTAAGLLLPAHAALAQRSQQSAQSRAQQKQPAATRGAKASATSATSAVATGGELPLKLAPRPTAPAITAADLMTRLYIFADDSMMGREAGTPGNVKGTDYIAAEARRIGLKPAGENGTFFQTIPMVVRAFDPRSSLAIEGGSSFDAWSDYAPVSGALLEGFSASRALDGVRAIYGGRLGDSTATITAEQAAGKLVVLSPATGPDGTPTFQFWNKGGFERFRGAAGVAIATLDISPPGVVGYLQQPQPDLDDHGAATPPIALLVTRAVAERLVGAPLATAAPGTVGRGLRGEIRYTATPTLAPARNVVAILPGSDPRLAGEYVAIGAHNDHVGIADEAVDHDSLRAFNHVLRPLGAESEPSGPETPDQVRAVRTRLDSLRHKHHAARADSISNGADDDGSGTVSVLEIAEELASRPVRPKRSILFVWHTGEEKGLFGSKYYTDHPTVPRDSIVAQLNIDMIGRGDSTDLAGGSPGYLQLIGSRRLSTELGDMVERVNKDSNAGLAFDYQYDANGHPMQYYCRSDHYEYARWGIPIVFFSTGGHQDYHQVTDEPQYIDYTHMARVASFVHDVALSVANLDHRVVVDKPKPDPYGTCKQ